MVLKFIKNCPPYVLNDIAGINDKLAKKLIDSNYAMEYKEEPKEAEIDTQDNTEENAEDEKQPKQNKNSKK